MPARQLVRRVVVDETDPAWGMPTDCCPGYVRLGDELLTSSHRSYPGHVHVACVERILNDAEPDLVEYPTFRAAQLDAMGRLPAGVCGVRLR